MYKYLVLIVIYIIGYLNFNLGWPESTKLLFLVISISNYSYQFLKKSLEKYINLV